MENYLAKESVNYAILITGSWGSGKTYYWKNDLVKLIKNTDVPGTPLATPEVESVGLKPKYRALYISLFGVKTIEDLNKKLFFEVCNNLKFLQSNTAKVIGEAAKSLLGLVDQFGIGGKIAQKAADAKLDYSKLLDFNDCVLCFDDLERASMEIDEILGYINNLVEHDKVKTIVIANEDEIVKLTKNIELKVQCALLSLPEKEQTLEKINCKMGELFQSNSRFAVIKEKTIGITVEFRPDVDVILPQIITESTTDETLLQVLEQCTPSIKEVVEKSQLGLNFRVIKYAISDFLVVCKYLKIKYPDMLNSLSGPLLKFVLSASLETKANKTTDRLDKPTLLAMGRTEQSLYYQGILGKKDDIVTKFVKKYYGQNMNELFSSEAVAELITSGYFDESKFEKEIKKWIPTEQTSADKILYGFWRLSDEEFGSAVADILTKVKRGEYPLSSYSKLFRSIEFFSKNGLVNASIAVLAKDFMDGLEASSSKPEATSSFDIDSLFNDEMSEENKAIKEKEYQLNESLRIKEVTREVDSLVDSFSDKIEDFCIGIASSKSSLWSQPVFKYVDINKMFDKILLLNNNQIAMFRNCLEERYKATNIHEFDVVGDYDNLQKLKGLLEEHVKHQDFVLSTHLKKVLIESIDKVTSKMKVAINKKDA